jgi:hypothetical protein
VGLAKELEGAVVLGSDHPAMSQPGCLEGSMKPTDLSYVSARNALLATDAASSWTARDLMNATIVFVDDSMANLVPLTTWSRWQPVYMANNPDDAALDIRTPRLVTISHLAELADSAMPFASRSFEAPPACA